MLDITIPEYSHLGVMEGSETESEVMFWKLLNWICQGAVSWWYIPLMISLRWSTWVSYSPSLLKSRSP